MHVFCTSAKAASVPLHGVGGVEISVEQVDGLQTLPLATPHSVSSWTRASTFWISRPLSSTEVHFGWQEGCIRCPHSHVGQGQRSPIMLQVVESGHDGESVWCRSS